MGFASELIVDIYLGLGSNLGDRRAQLSAALDALSAGGVRVARVSPVVESPALLPDDAPADWNRPFLNIVAECRVPEQSAHELLDGLQHVERQLGRGEHARWAPRPIDVDLLLFGREEIASERIRIPHPGLTQRAFVLAPLAALRPRLTIPGAGSTTVLAWSRKLAARIPLWMGIVNVTPDSFSDGGHAATAENAAAHAAALAEAGAHLIDVGAESTRPGAAALTAEQEWARLEPALARILQQHAHDRLRPLVSVDTYHAATARRALALGADVINDVGGLTSREMIELAGASGKDWIAMHHVSVPADRTKTLPVDRDPCELVDRWLDERFEEWQHAGLDPERIIFDPGIGFGKNPLQSLRLLRGIERFARHGLRCLVGHSRKSFMTAFAAEHNADKDLATVGASLALCGRGVEILRVHNVAAHATAYRGWAHLQP
jgi:2-amino-4-hydroxy-6-hydroxymethyldihydropteridine diphosphokinase/dihydropteroate synthase